MAIVSKDSPYHGRRGRDGPLVFRELNGQTVVQAAGRKPSGPASAAQLAQRGLNFRSRQYGKAQSDNPASKAVYATGTSRSYPSAYAVATRDYRMPPEITLLDVSSYQGRAGDPIRVLATDDFGVVAVQVRIISAAGQLQEAGPATQQADGSWRYEATEAAPATAGLVVLAEAYDRPGNVASAQQLL